MKTQIQVEKRTCDECGLEAHEWDACCRACDARLKTVGTDPLYSAFLRIADLRAERKRWGNDSEARKAAAEAELKKLNTPK